MSRDIDACKVFVGNVPFECNKIEFQECFENIDGFIKAEIIYKPNTNISRGFGYLIFNKPENAKKIIDRNDIFFKDRRLRFTEYSFSKKKMDITNTFDDYQKNKNYLLVKNLPKSMTRDELKNIFQKITSIGRHFIVTDSETGMSKGYGIIEIKDDIMYDLFVKERNITTEDGHTYELTKWKISKSDNYLNNEYDFKQFDKKITKSDLHKAFTAGRNIGVLEGIKISKSFR